MYYLLIINNYINIYIKCNNLIYFFSLKMSQKSLS